MIKLYVKEVCLKKGFKATQSQLMSFGVGYTTAKHLLHGEIKSIRLDVLEKLCYHLDCYVQDLFEYVPDPKFPIPANHPIQKIYRPIAPVSPPDVIKDFSPEKLEKVHAFIDKLRKD